MRPNLVARDVAVPDPTPNDLLITFHADPLGKFLPREQRRGASEISCRNLDSFQFHEPTCAMIGLIWIGADSVSTLYSPMYKSYDATYPLYI
ncbi:hypothetical protein D3C76_1208440 [compost metagenome]